MAKPSTKQNAAPQFEPRFIEADAANAPSLLREAGDKAESLIEAWVRTNNANALNAVVLNEAASSRLRKSARRGLGVLKSRGIQLPERAAAATPARPEVAPGIEAWFLPTDQSGISTITVASSSTGQRRDIADVRIHETAGIIDMQTGEATRSSLREGFEHLQSRVGYAPAPVPVEWARWQIAKAKARNASTGVVLPLGFDVSANLLNPVPTSEPPHPLDATGLKVEGFDAEKRAAMSAALHREPEFSPWLPEIKAVTEMLQKVGERLGFKPPDDQALFMRVLNEEVAAAVDRFFTPELRQRLAERMKDAAISVLHRAGKERALDVLATADAVRHAGLITSPPSEVPFLKTFFDKALSMVAASSGGRLSIPMPSGSVGGRAPVVAPPEALAESARTAAGERDSEPSEEETSEPEGQPAP